MNPEKFINQYDFNLSYAKALVEDLSEEQMTMTPSTGLENHPAWTLGHLISGSAMMVEDLGGIFEMPDGWAELFLRNGPGDPRIPDPDRSKYPSKKLLIEELEKQHNIVKELLAARDSDFLNEKCEWRFSKFMPTNADVIIFMCISHEAMHLGQLAAWRRAMRLPSALAQM